MQRSALVCAAGDSIVEPIADSGKHAGRIAKLVSGGDSDILESFRKVTGNCGRETIAVFCTLPGRGSPSSARTWWLTLQPGSQVPHLKYITAYQGLVPANGKKPTLRGNRRSWSTDGDRTSDPTLTELTLGSYRCPHSRSSPTEAKITTCLAVRANHKRRAAPRSYCPQRHIG